jgi:hypothetical protein
MLSLILRCPKSGEQNMSCNVYTTETELISTCEQKIKEPIYGLLSVSRSGLPLGTAEACEPILRTSAPLFGGSVSNGSILQVIY